MNESILYVLMSLCSLDADADMMSCVSLSQPHDVATYSSCLPKRFYRVFSSEEEASTSLFATSPNIAEFPNCLLWVFAKRDRGLALTLLISLDLALQFVLMYLTS